MQHALCLNFYELRRKSKLSNEPIFEFTIMKIGLPIHILNFNGNIKYET